MRSGYQLSNYAAQLANQEAEIQRVVCNISFVQAAFGIQLNGWRCNSRAAISEIALMHKQRRANESLRAASARGHNA